VFVLLTLCFAPEVSASAANVWITQSGNGTPRRKNNYGGDKDYNDPYVLTVASAVRGKATCWTHCFPSYVRSLLELSVIVKWKSVRKAKRPVRTIVANDWKKA
jgi:hypothetical protein